MALLLPAAAETETGSDCKEGDTGVGRDAHVGRKSRGSILVYVPVHKSGYS